MKKDKKNVLSLLAILVPVLLSVAVITFVILLMKYSEVSLVLVLLISVALFSFIGLIILAVSFSINKRNSLMMTITTAIAFVCLLIACYGIYYLYNINSSVNQIIVDGNEKEVVTVVFVTFNESKIESIDDINVNSKFGYIDNTAFQEGNVLALEEIENNDIDVELMPYDNYNDLLLGLFNEEIDIVAVPENYYEMFVVNEGYQEYLDKTKVIHQYSKEILTNGVDTVVKNIAEEPFTLLLMGVDEKRADALILASFNPQRMTVTMTHIARDSFVPIACYRNNQSDKINHARAVSRSCMIETVEDLMETEIDFFVEVNFKGVVDIVDALGGLWLTSPVQFIGQSSSYDRGTYNVWVGEGYQLMNGEQTLAFARERHEMPNGDFSRQENQKKIIVELISVLLETRDVNQALSVIKAAGSNISTNMSLNQITQLLNFGFDVLKDTYVGQRNGSLIFKVISTSLAGYASSTYNEGLQLPLWIYKPYKGSISDNVDIINRNLEIDKTLNQYYKADFDIVYPHYEPTSYVPDTYNETKIHEKLPDFMPEMVRGNEIWTLESVNKWHASRTSVNLVLKPIVAGDPLYNDSYQHHQIIYQSVRYGIKTSNITNLEIHYIQKDLNCTLMENQEYIECSDSYVVPNFVGQSKDDVNIWKTSHSDKIVDIKDVDNITAIDFGITYNQSLVGKIGAQSDAQYTKWQVINNKMTVYYFLYPRIELKISVISTLNGEGAVKKWFSDNGWLVEPEFEHVYSSVSAGNVISVRVRNDDGTFTTLTSNTTNYRTNRKVYITLSKGSEVTTALPDFVTQNLYLSNFEAYMSSVGLSTASVVLTQIDRPEGSDETLIGRITDQSVPAGTTNYQLIRTIALTIYK